MRLFGRKSSPTETVRQDATASAAVVADAPATGDALADSPTADAIGSAAPEAAAAPAPDAAGIGEGTGPQDAPSTTAPATIAASSAASVSSASAKTSARLAFLEKGNAMTSTPPKPPAASFLSGTPRGDVPPRRVLDMPGVGVGSSAAASALGAPGLTAPAVPVPPEPAALTAEPQRRLTVGRDILLAGEIASCDVLVVEGTVEAKLRDGHSIEVTESGLFKGSVEIDDADIGGRFEGDIVVRNRLRVRSSGRITGSIVYGELEVENGGRLEGTIKIYNPSAAVTVAPVPESAPVNTTGSQTDSNPPGDNQPTYAPTFQNYGG